MPSKYPPTRCIAVDVDGTLYTRGVLNTRLVEWCKVRKEQGFYLLLWSARGREYAVKAAEKAGVTDVFDTIIAKPGYIVDDLGWSWIKHTVAVTTLEDARVLPRGKHDG